MFKKRQEAVLSSLTDTGFDGMVLNAGPSLVYFSGLHFHLSERPVLFFLVAGKKPLIVLPALEEAKLEGLDFELEALSYPDDPARWQEVFTAACIMVGLKELKMGFEPRQFRLLEYRYLRMASATTSYESCDEAIAQCRSFKDQDEVSRMQTAVNIAQESLKSILPQLRAGLTEQEVAAELAIELYRHDSDHPLPFSPIVSAGPNGANPHAKPSARRLKEGDLLVIDWGASWQGYASDLTRTFAIGEVDDEARHIHELVRNANEAGRAAARPGAPCSAVDMAARSVIEAAGYGASFRHRTGHGIGMECHEEPYIHEANLDILKPGMTFTVEPGIYLAGKYGARVEDDVLITENGSRSLSDLNRELISLAG
ncbi:MAG: M24 family metallopeptidase [Desulfocapsaceae bacterium]